MQASGGITVLGIESSCDDTAAAVIRRAANGGCEILSNVVRAEHAAHRTFGGIVPELAARAHVEHIDHVIRAALTEADVAPGELDLVAATGGPGLIGGVMVGLTAGKAVAIAHGLRFAPINHLEGHALSARMVGRADLPYLLLLASGGHTQLIWVEEIGRYRRLGTTIDDAAGEAFDKTAKLLGLPQPGGPSIEALAAEGRPDRYDFPEPLARREGCDFSLSGLKTAVRIAAEALPQASRSDIADIARGFQDAIARHIAARTGRAMDLIAGSAGASPRLVVAGGVAANRSLRASLASQCQSRGWTMIVPPAEYCTDNAAMIAWTGAERLAAGLLEPPDAALAFAPRARWPLAPVPEGAAFGGGRKGPKA